jgi:dipeptidyl aminopeptidase/acylaminoacyl peptidase
MAIRRQVQKLEVPAMKAAFGALLLSLVITATTSAQATVPVNLYVAELTCDGGTIHIGTPRKLTANRGINSQPSFTPDGKSILFVRRDSANGQGDVYRIDLATGSETRITSTPEMENSPTIQPDGKLMVIRWTPSTLFKEWGPWLYDMNGAPVKGVLPGPDTVGYYVRLDSVTFAMMRPKSVGAISIFDTRSGSMTDYDFRPANLPPQKIPGQRAISYTRVDSVGGNRIRRLDLITHDTTEIAPAQPRRVVHAWTPRGTILMGNGNAIFTLTPPAKTWTQVASFTDPQLQEINTYVVSPAGDKLILISPVTPTRR